MFYEIRKKEHSENVSVLNGFYILYRPLHLVCIRKTLPDREVLHYG